MKNVCSAVYKYLLAACVHTRKYIFGHFQQLYFEMNLKLISNPGKAGGII